jgi:hypothetical protein
MLTPNLNNTFSLGFIFIRSTLVLKAFGGEDIGSIAIVLLCSGV